MVQNKRTACQITLGCSVRMLCIIALLYAQSGTLFSSMVDGRGCLSQT